MFDLIVLYRKQLCPVLISLLGVPKVEKGGITQWSQSHDEGSGKGLSILASSPNNLGSSAKIIYRLRLFLCVSWCLRQGEGEKLALIRYVNLCTLLNVSQFIGLMGRLSAGMMQMKPCSAPLQLTFLSESCGLLTLPRDFASYD